MSLEIYWKKALEQTRLSIDDESLYPLKTDIITRDLYEKDDFIIRKPVSYTHLTLPTILLV